MNPRILPRYWAMYHSLKVFFFVQSEKWDDALKHFIEAGKVIGQYHSLLNVKNCTVNRNVQSIFHIALLVEQFGTLIQHFPETPEILHSLPEQLK